MFAELLPAEKSGGVTGIQISTQLLQVRRQQRTRRQKLLLFVHHLRLTRPLVVGACGSHIQETFDLMPAAVERHLKDPKVSAFTQLSTVALKDKSLNTKTF